MSPNGNSQATAPKFSAFSARLVQCAEIAGFTAARLAAEAEVRRGTMARYWHGERMFPADLLFRVADILDVNPRWLGTGEGSMVPPLEVDPAAAPDEDRLLDAFRRLTPEQRGHVTQSAQLLASSRALHSPRSTYRAEPPYQDTP
jgi:transcriptional regulator with XRE-family HTH domain